VEPQGEEEEEGERGKTSPPLISLLFAKEKERTDESEHFEGKIIRPFAAKIFAEGGKGRIGGEKNEYVHSACSMQRQ